MPVPSVQKLTKQAKKSKAEGEKLWKEAKKLASEELGKPENSFDDQDWSYVMGIFKNMLGLEESFMKEENLTEVRLDNNTRKIFIEYAKEIATNLRKDYPDASYKLLKNSIWKIMVDMGLDSSNSNYKNKEKYMPKIFNKFLFDNDGGNKYDSSWFSLRDEQMFNIIENALRQLGITESVMKEENGYTLYIKGNGFFIETLDFNYYFQFSRISNGIAFMKSHAVKEYQLFKQELESQIWNRYNSFPDDISIDLVNRDMAINILNINLIKQSNLKKIANLLWYLKIPDETNNIIDDTTITYIRNLSEYNNNKNKHKNFFEQKNVSFKEYLDMYNDMYPMEDDSLEDYESDDYIEAEEKQRLYSTGDAYDEDEDSDYYNSLLSFVGDDGEFEETMTSGSFGTAITTTITSKDGEEDNDFGFDNEMEEYKNFSNKHAKSFKKESIQHDLETTIKQDLIHYGQGVDQSLAKRPFKEDIVLDRGIIETIANNFGIDSEDILQYGDKLDLQDKYGNDLWYFESFISLIRGIERAANY